MYLAELLTRSVHVVVGNSPVVRPQQESIEGITHCGEKEHSCRPFVQREGSSNRMDSISNSGVPNFLEVGHSADRHVCINAKQQTTSVLCEKQT